MRIEDITLKLLLKYSKQGLSLKEVANIFDLEYSKVKNKSRAIGYLAPSKFELLNNKISFEQGLTLTEFLLQALKDERSNNWICKNLGITVKTLYAYGKELGLNVKNRTWKLDSNAIDNIRNGRLNTIENDPNVRRLNAFGKNLTIAQWSRETGIGKGTIISRILRNKWDNNSALTIEPSLYHSGSTISPVKNDLKTKNSRNKEARVIIKLLLEDIETSVFGTWYIIRIEHTESYLEDELAEEYSKSSLFLNFRSEYCSVDMAAAFTNRNVAIAYVQYLRGNKGFTDIVAIDKFDTDYHLIEKFDCTDQMRARLMKYCEKGGVSIN